MNCLNSTVKNFVKYTVNMLYVSKAAVGIAVIMVVKWMVATVHSDS